MGKDPQKIREDRLRRMAQRQGLMLEKSRRRDPNALDFGCYRLIDTNTKGVVFGATPLPYSATLDEIEAWLTDDGDAAAA
jgi:hypothetical protein